MQLGEAVQIFHDHVDAVILRAVAEFSTTIIKVFKHDEAMRASVIVPIGIIAFGGGHFHFMYHEIIKAGLQRMDIDIVEGAGPISLHAQIGGQSGSDTCFIPVDPDPPFGRMAVEQFHRVHRFRDDAGIFISHHAAQPCGINAVHRSRNMIGPRRIWASNAIGVNNRILILRGGLRIHVPLLLYLKFLSDGWPS